MFKPQRPTPSPMRSARGLAATFVCLAAIALSGLPGLGLSDEPPPISGSGKSLVYPRKVLSKLFSEEVEVAMAAIGGQVVAATSEQVSCFKDDRDQPAWTAGDKQGWKLVQDLAISKDGGRVFFQTDVSPKKSTESKQLTMRLLDGEGAPVWERENPYRYFSARLSPTGRYILMGEHMHPGVTLYDQAMNELWTREIQFWYVAFDPLEHFVFDGEGGRLYTIEGAQTWEFDRGTRILSVSDDAEMVMAQYFRYGGNQKSIFLNGRLALAKAELPGVHGCVSPDGLFTAYVNPEGKLVVYRSRELLEHGPEKLEPLMEDSFFRPWVMNIARDNRSLLVMGHQSKDYGVLRLYDLDKFKAAWTMPVDKDARVAIPAEDNRHVLVRVRPNLIEKYECY